MKNILTKEPKMGQNGKFNGQKKELKGVLMIQAGVGVGDGQESTDCRILQSWTPCDLIIYWMWGTVNEELGEDTKVPNQRTQRTQSYSQIQEGQTVWKPKLVSVNCFELAELKMTEDSQVNLTSNRVRNMGSETGKVDRAEESEIWVFFTEELVNMDKM